MTIKTNPFSLKKTIKSNLIKRPEAWSTFSALKSHAYRQAYIGLSRFLSPHGSVVSANALGLSNRIKCLLSAMRIAAQVDRPIAVHWPRNWACRCDFKDLFENDFLIFDDETIASVKTSAERGKRFIVVDTWRLLMLPSEMATERKNSLNESPSLDFAYQDAPSNLKDAYLHQAKRLRPVKHVEDAASSFASHFDDSTIAVSIRSWPDCKERADALFRIENVFRHLDAQSTSNFFVSCDSEVVLAAIRERYGDRVLTFPKRTGTNDRVSPIGMQDILIDMLLLGRCRHLIASYLSTYPETAWWLGGAGAKVTLIEDPEDIRRWERDHNHDNTEIMPKDALAGL